MNDDTQRWKDKYLTSLEQQEEAERRWQERLDLLRRGLVRSSLAAEGSDKAVDQCMQELREAIRGEQMDKRLVALIPRLEKAVLDSEQRRRQRVQQNIEALNQLAQQLLGLELPGDVRKPLRQFARRIEERASQSREIPLLLGELSGLQKQALEHLDNPAQARPGLLQRLFGRAPQAEPATTAPVPPAPSEATRQSAAPAPQGEPAALAAVAEPPAAAPVPSTPPAPLGATRQGAEPAPLAEPAALAAVAEPPTAAPISTPPPAPAEAARQGAEPAPLAEPAAPEPEPLSSADQGDDTPEASASPVDPVPDPAVSGETASTPAQPGKLMLDSLPLPASLVLGPLSEGDPDYALPPPEPGYSAIAPHVADSLRRLLDELELPVAHQPQASALRQRLGSGLNWYELVPVLDDLGVLVLAVADGGQREFTHYLQQLNERLSAFLGTLSETHEGYAASREDTQQLDQELHSQVSELRQSVQDAADLDSLKQSLEQRLDGLLERMRQYRLQRDQREQQITGRLQGLVERVASMEQEASGFRARLEQQRQKSLVDPLTGLPNRAAWSERLELEVARLRRYGGELLLAVLDIDHFKRINDSYGHLAGDKVLKLIAGELARRLRKTDFIARFGGEEFVLLLPGTAIEGGLQLLEQLRGAIEACPFHFKGEPVTITLSAGIAAFGGEASAEAVFENADQALYRAKQQGRNRVETG